MVQQKLNFVEEILDFYFEGKFSETISQGGIDLDELKKWANIAALYQFATAGKDYNLVESGEAFSLIEDLFTSLSVDLSFGESIDEYNFREVAEDFGIDPEKYADVAEKAFGLIRDNNSVEVFQLFDRK